MRFSAKLYLKGHTLPMDEVFELAFDELGNTTGVISGA